MPGGPRSKRDGGKGTDPARAPRDADAAAFIEPPRPLKPRPVLLAVLSVIFALWMAFLVALYFKTVYPRHNGTTTKSAVGATSPGDPAGNSAPVG